MGRRRRVQNSARRGRDSSKSEIRRLYTVCNVIGVGVGLLAAVVATIFRGYSLIHSGMAGGPVIVYGTISFAFLLTIVPIFWAFCRNVALYESVSVMLHDMLSGQKESYFELLQKRAVIQIQMRVLAAWLTILGTIVAIYSPKFAEWVDELVTQALVLLVPSKFGATVFWTCVVLSWFYLLFEQWIVIPLVQKYIEIQAIEIRLGTLSRNGDATLGAAPQGGEGG